MLRIQCDNPGCRELTPVEFYRGGILRVSKNEKPIEDYHLCDTCRVALEDSLLKFIENYLKLSETVTSWKLDVVGEEA